MQRLVLWGVLVAGLLWVSPLPVMAEVYRYVDERGVIHFTDTPTSSYFGQHQPTSGPGSYLSGLIRRYARMYGLEEELVRAVIKTESDFNPVAISKKGALGLMQLMPPTALEMDVSNPLNSEQNIRGGTRYLRKMLDLFSNDLDLALAAYNAGPGAVRRYKGIPPYQETRNYVKKVKEFLNFYRGKREASL